MQIKFVCIIAAALQCLGPSPRTFEIADKSADKSVDKVCLDLCLTNFIQNADARARKSAQNADKLCLPEFVCRRKFCRQSLSILELALIFHSPPTVCLACWRLPARLSPGWKTHGDHMLGLCSSFQDKRKNIQNGGGHVQHPPLAP